jgi:hypothetical protein
MMFKATNSCCNYQVKWFTGADGIVELTMDKAQDVIILARGLGVKIIDWNIKPACTAGQVIIPGEGTCVLCCDQ